MPLRRLLFELSRYVCRRGDGREDQEWRRPGSNRRPPACKAGALPAELRPHDVMGRPSGAAAWAFLDSNQRPHGYQPCALTN
jgi:hypothetical protein